MSWFTPFLTRARARSAVENFMNAMASVRTAPPLPAESTTDAGALDVLGSINESLLYDDLIGSSDEPPEISQ